jgi:hypothetical protein
METLSHYHYEIYCYKHVPINLNHASTCTSTYNQPVPQTSASTMHQPVINLYHKQVHQPCTNLYSTCTINKCIQPCAKYVPIMCQLLINYDSSICTNIISYTPHVCAPTHQLLVSTIHSTCTSTKIPHQFHHPNLICSSVIYLVYMITFLQTFLSFKNKRLEFSSNLSLVSHA